MTEGARLFLAIAEIDTLDENLNLLAEKVTTKLNWLVGLVTSLLVAVVVALVTTVISMS